MGQSISGSKQYMVRGAAGAVWNAWQDCVKGLVHTTRNALVIHDNVHQWLYAPCLSTRPSEYLLLHHHLQLHQHSDDWGVFKIDRLITGVPNTPPQTPTPTSLPACGCTAIQV
jgi:hypothetical protein